MGAGLADQSTVLTFNPDGEGGFNGVGFGFQKEYLPGDLSQFNQKRGKIMFRFSNAQHSFDIAFMNDFKFGRLFNGDGTDFGNTGTLIIGYTEILSSNSSFRSGIALELFTPKPDYARTPNNPTNSDDGRKNVWYTETPYASLFYANLYAFGQYQDGDYNAFAKAGFNSQKLGAYIQNLLHDGIGLNPRFPWDVTAKDKIFTEVGGSLITTERYDN